MDKNPKRLLHVFFVHSHISYLVSKAIISHKALEKEDVIFLLDRGISIPDGDRHETAPHELTHQPSRSLRRILQNRRKKTVALDFLNNISEGRPVELYINRMNQPASFLFSRLPTLRDINIYEEGLAAYARPLTRLNDIAFLKTDLRTRIARMLSGFPGAETESYYIDTYKEAFGTSERAFPGFPRRVLLDLMPVVAAAKDSGFSDIAQDATILALPQLFAFKTNPEMSGALEDVMVACIETSASTTYFKLHPDRYDASAYIDQLAGRVRARTGVDFRDHLVPDLPLEVIATRRSDIVIAVLVSSLAIYARFFRSRVLSFAKPVYGPDNPKVRTLLTLCPDAIFVEPDDTHSAIRKRLQGSTTGPT